MYINATNSRIVFGRFTVLPNEKVPAFPLTAEEDEAVKRLLKKGVLVEKPNVHKSEVAPQPTPKPAPAPEVKPAPAPEVKPVATPEAKPESKDNKKAK